MEQIYIRWIDLLIGGVGLLIGLYSLIVNIIILIVLVRMSRRSVSDTIFCHLALTDIVASIDAIFAFGLLLSDRTFFDFYFIDDLICQFTGITWCVISIATPLLLSLISLGRFLALYLPHKYERIYCPPLSSFLVALTWIISLIGGTMHVWKLENMRMEPGWGYCDYRLVDIYTKTQVRYIVVFLYSIPLTISTSILLFCNIAVAIRLIRLQFQKPIAALTAVMNKTASLDKCHTTGLDTTFSNFNMDQITAASSDFGTNDISINLEITEDKGKTNKVVPRPSNTTSPGSALERGKSKKPGGPTFRRRKKEKQVIIATLLFSLNFGICYFVMLYYYFSYMISPTYNVFAALSRQDPITDTYILGWFYYATFLSSSINPLIHFCCNSKIRTGCRSLFSSLRNKLAGHSP